MIRWLGRFSIALALATACGGGDDTPDATGSGGSGGSGATSTGTSSTGTSSTGASGGVSLEEACTAYCNAIGATPCVQPGFTLKSCILGCPTTDKFDKEYCHDAYRDFYACRTEDGFTCMSGNPIPNALCYDENVSILHCLREAVCPKYCDRAAAIGCAPEEAACVDACRTDQQELSVNGSCGAEFDLMMSCKAQNLVCQGGVPSAKECDLYVFNLASCPSLDRCVGYCFAAASIGCGSEEACLGDCQPKLADPECGAHYQDLLDCAVADPARLTCANDTPTPAADCVSYEFSYKSCKMM